MSDSDTDRNQCVICGEFVAVGSIANHLRDRHSGEPDVVEDMYGSRMAERAFNSEGDHNQHNQETVSLNDSTGGRECEICGEFVEPTDETETLTVQKANEHINENHPDTDQSVTDVFGEWELTTGDSDGGNKNEESSETTEASVTNRSTNSTNTRSSQASEGTPRQMDSSKNSSERKRDSSRGSGGSSSATQLRQDVAGRGKYSVFGVGGAGNRILDSMVMRRDTLQDRNSRLAKAWEGGLNTYLPLNTNDAEIVGTYYQQADQDLDQQDVIYRCAIGDNPVGAGEDPAIGLKYMEDDIANAPTETIRSWPFNEGDLQNAQAIMYIHSVVKGTGSGATPPLAEYIRENILEEDHSEKGNTPMMGVTILPNEKATKFNPEVTVNAGFGIGMMASRVNVLLPFDNERLGDAARDISPEINELEERNHAYSDINRPLVQFLEAFMLSSNSEMIDRDATSQLTTGEASDNGFDVPDSFRPVASRYPLTDDDEVRPGVVAAPLMTVSESTHLDETGMGILIESAFNQGLFVNCKPETAWGGTFIFYGPKEPMKDVSRHIQDYTAHEKIADSLGTSDLRLRLNQAVVPEVDNLYMWGLLWNPKMPAMEEMFEKTKEAKERNNDVGKLLTENWDEISPVFSYLGRENRE